MHKAFILLLFLAFCPTSLDATERNEAPNTTKPLVVYAVSNNFPFSYALPDGTVTGLYVDIWQLWSKTNDIPIEIKLSNLNDALNIIKTSPAIHSGVFMTDERKEWAEFSIPFHHIKTGVLLNKEVSQSVILSDRKDFKIGVFVNTYQEKLVRNRYPENSLFMENNTSIILEHLRKGSIDALVGEVPFLDGIVQQRGLQGLLHVSHEVLATNEIYAIASKQYPELIKLVNKGFDNIPIKQLIALEKKWIPTQEPFFANLIEFDELTIDEKKWLQSKKNYSRGFEVFWEPFEFKNKNNEVLGITTDYLELISDKLEINFIPDHSVTWLEALEALKKNNLDIITAIVKTPERSKDLTFTNPYFSSQTAIVTRKDTVYIDSMKSLAGKKLGLVRGYALSELIANDYPDIEIVEVDTLVDSFKKVQSMELDATINATAVVNDAIEQYDLTDLIIVGTSPYRFEISMAVRNELAPLIPILNKAIASITDKEKALIANTWLPIGTDSRKELRLILTWLIPILFILILLIVYFSRLNAKLNQEIRHRKKTEQDRIKLEGQLHQSQKLEALGNLTGGIAHDFNNMLGVIMGYSELLSKASSGDSKLIRYSNHIRQAGERGVKLTQKLLSITKNTSVDATKININDVLNEDKDMLQKTLTVRITIEYQLEESIWPVWLDKSDLEDAILNVSINSMHAMMDIEQQPKLLLKTKNITVDAATAMHPSLKEGDYVMLSIMDNGCGMDDEEQKQMFDPFFTTKGDKGTGLGLSLVFGFMKRSSGTIVVNSKLNQGTEIQFYFPRFTQSEPKKVFTKVYSDEDLFGTEAILIIDDEPALKSMTAEILTQRGYQCFEASSAQEGLDLLKTQSIDLILSDIIMPEMDGYKLSEIVKEQYPNIQILFVSGFSENAESMKQSDRLEQNIIAKPYQTNELLKRVRQLLDQ